MPEDPVARYGTIAVVPAQYVPNHDFLPYAKGPTAGAFKGALGGVGDSAQIGMRIASGSGGGRDDWGKPLGAVLITIALLPILVPMGAIEGSQAALPIEHVERLERNIHSVVEQAKLHHQLASQIAKSTIHLPLVQHDIHADFGPTSPQHRPDYQNLKNNGINTVLEVAVGKARFKTVGEHHRRMQMELSAVAHMVGTENNQVLKSGTYTYESPAFPLNSWTDNSGHRLNIEFTHGFQYLADSVINGLVEPSYWPLPIMRPTLDVCGLMPISPKLEYQRAKYKGSKLVKPAEVVTTTVSSVQPTLHWDTFAVESGPPVAGKISNVRYDLRVWAQHGESRGRMIYERHYLPHATHQLEIQLHPYTTYLWSIRARYEMHGRRLVTPWSYSAIKPEGPGVWCFDDGIPEYSYFKFRTPAR
jgi:hypothetical protein